MRYKLIDKPDGSGSSTKDFNIEDNLFYVSRGTYGGKKVTLVIFNNSNLEYCFEGIISFKNQEDVIQELLSHDFGIIFKIINTVGNNSYESGYRDGVDSIKRAFRDLIL